MKNEETLTLIEKYLKVFKIKSCLLIYFYLLIYGKNTPGHLKSELKISKATLFRNLGFLMDAGFLDKEELRAIPDKRYNLHYFCEKAFDEICNIEISPDFKKFVQAKGKTSVLEEWEKTVKNHPSIFSNVLARLFDLKRGKEKEFQKPRIIRVQEEFKELQLEKKQERSQERRIRVFTIMEASEEDIFEKLGDFLHSLKLKDEIRVKKGEKMSKPLSLVIDLIEF